MLAALGDAPAPPVDSFHCKLLLRSLWTNTRSLYGIMRFEPDRCTWVQSYAALVPSADAPMRCFSMPYDQIQRIELHKKRSVSFILRGGEVYQLSFFFRNSEVIAQIGNSMHHLVPIEVSSRPAQDASSSPIIGQRLRGIAITGKPSSSSSSASSSSSSPSLSSSASSSSFLMRVQLHPSLKRQYLWFDLPCEYSAHVEAEQVFEESMRHFEEANRRAIRELLRDSLSSTVPLHDDSPALPGTLYLLTLREATCEFPLRVLQEIPDLPVRVRIRIEEQSEMGMRVKETLDRFKSNAAPLPRDLQVHSWAFSKCVSGVWRNRQIRIFFELEAEDQSSSRTKNHICIGTCWFSVPPLRRRVDRYKIEVPLVYAPKMPASLEPTKTYLHFYVGPFDLWPKDSEVRRRLASPALPDKSVLSTADNAPQSIDFFLNEASCYRTDTDLFEAREKLRQPPTEARLKDRNNQMLTLMYGGFLRLANPPETIEIPVEPAVDPVKNELDERAAYRLGHSIEQIHARHFAVMSPFPNLEIIASRDASASFSGILNHPQLQDDIHRLNVAQHQKIQAHKRFHQVFAPSHAPALCVPDTLALPPASPLSAADSAAIASRPSPWPVPEIFLFKYKFWMVFSVMILLILSIGIIFDGIIFFFGSINSILQILTD